MDGDAPYDEAAVAEGLPLAGPHQAGNLAAALAAFHQLEPEWLSDPLFVATAIGLLVAIPAVIAFNSFTRRVKRLMSEADSLSAMALAQIAAEDKS